MTFSQTATAISYARRAAFFYLQASYCESPVERAILAAQGDLAGRYAWRCGK